MAHILMEQLKPISKIDYIISNHAEQDHSGSIPQVLSKYKNAKVIVSDQGAKLLHEHLELNSEVSEVVNDGQTISLGNKTLEFIYTPWVHWPETMVTYAIEDNMLFSCDFFGSHIATSEMYVSDEGRVYEAAKRFFAEIMLPFRKIILKNMEKIRDLKIETIAPSHGPIYPKPYFIIDAYNDWLSDQSKNLALLMYVSMHGSTKKMVEHLVSRLGEQKVEVAQFDLSNTDIGKLAINLIDATTLVIATPAVRVGPHPLVINAVVLGQHSPSKSKICGHNGIIWLGQQDCRNNWTSRTRS